MLRVQRLPEVLKSVLSDGVKGAVLMTVEGSIVSSISADNAKVSETELAAVASCVYGNYAQGTLTLAILYTHYVSFFKCFSQSRCFFDIIETW